MDNMDFVNMATKFKHNPSYNDVNQISLVLTS